MGINNIYTNFQEEKYFEEVHDIGTWVYLDLDDIKRNFMQSQSHRHDADVVYLHTHKLDR